MRLLSRRLLPIVVLVRCCSVQDAESYTWPERVLLLDSVTTVVPIGNSRSTSSRGGVVSVFARGFNVLATGGGCTDFIVYGKYLALVCWGCLRFLFRPCLPRFAVVIFTAIFPLGTPVSMLRFGDCRGVQPLRTGRLVYSLLIMQIWATCRQGVAQIGRPGVERFATFWGIHGEFGTT